MKLQSIVRMATLVVFGIIAFSAQAMAQCDTAGLKPDPTGQGRYWMTGRTAPLSVFSAPAYSGSDSLRGLERRQAGQVGIACQKYWNEFPDHAEEVILSDTAPVMVEIDRDQVSPLYLDGCRMHGKRYYNRLTPVEVAQYEAPQPPPIYLPSQPQQIAYQGQPQVIVMQSPPITITNTNTNTNKNSSNSISAAVSVARAISDIYSTMRNGQSQGQRQSSRNSGGRIFQPQPRQPRQPPVQPPQKCDPAGDCSPPTGGGTGSGTGRRRP